MTFDEFFHAASIGDIDGVRTALKTNPKLIEGKDEYEFSILHFAGDDHNTMAIANLLIDAGADVNAKNDDGITPLHIVLQPEMASLLIVKGANVNAQANDGCTPLRCMAAEGDDTAEVVEVLLNAGADPSITDTGGSSPLDVAKQRHEPELIALLTRS